MPLRLRCCLASTLSMSAAALSAAPQRVLCYGDSLTAGTSPPLDQDYPYAPVLEAALGSSVLVRHRGLPGATAAGMLDVLDDEQRGLRALLKRAEPALCVILAGTNDLSYEPDASTIASSVVGLHELAHGLGVPTVCVGIPPSQWQAMAPEAAERAAAVNRELRAWCADRGVFAAYVDHPIAAWNPGDERWAPDGLHFSPDGYRLCGEGLADVVRRRLKRTRRKMKDPDAAA